MFGITIDIPAPIEAYDTVHAEMLRSGDRQVEGLIVHLARPTETGFQVIEVWDSRERFEYYQRTLVGPMAERLMGEAPPPTKGAPFEVRGIVIPGADLYA